MRTFTFHVCGKLHYEVKGGNSYADCAGMALVIGFGFVMAGCGSSPVPQQVDLTGVASYYVRADGRDTNAGTSEDAPFKTLTKAVAAAATTQVKKITVIGTLVENTVIKETDPTVKKPTKNIDVTEW